MNLPRFIVMPETKPMSGLIGYYIVDSTLRITDLVPHQRVSAVIKSLADVRKLAHSMNMEHNPNYLDEDEAPTLEAQSIEELAAASLAFANKQAETSQTEVSEPPTSSEITDAYNEAIAKELEVVQDLGAEEEVIPVEEMSFSELKAEVKRRGMKVPFGASKKSLKEMLS